jgi:light-regulated signal transduction histidine kinase (bacteriophytochrome)
MLSPLESADGVLVTAAIRNITARKHSEAQLLEKVKELNRSNEELQQFAYIASHDLQEPLRMVASYTALLARRYKGKLDSDADDFIAFAVDGASRMQLLIRDLLAYSRVGSKGKELADTSSENALQQAIHNLRGAIEGSGAFVTHDALPSVMADEMQLTQVFQNLVGNAINLPKMDGREVLAAVKGDVDLKTIPIVILTTSDAESDITRSYQLQANCYLTKPVRLDEFENLMKSVNDFWLTKVKLP